MENTSLIRYEQNLDHPRLDILKSFVHEKISLLEDEINREREHLFQLFDQLYEKLTYDLKMQISNQRKQDDSINYIKKYLSDNDISYCKAVEMINTVDEKQEENLSIDNPDKVVSTILETIEEEKYEEKNKEKSLFSKATEDYMSKNAKNEPDDDDQLWVDLPGDTSIGCDESCKGWDGNSDRCNCGNRRVYWRSDSDNDDDVYPYVY
jgi:hypothetical protein